jgi:transcription-repair coupling factor (superfamily II helicase)
MQNFEIFPEIETILRILKDKKILTVSGFSGSSLPLFIMDLRKYSIPVVYITNKNNIERFGGEIIEILSRAIIIDENHQFIEDADIIITSEDFLYKKIPVKESYELIQGEKIDREDLLSRLIISGLQREDIVEEEGEYAIRGGIIDFFLPDSEPIRIEFDGETISSIRKFDTITQRSIEHIKSFSVKLARNDFSTTVIESLSKNTICITERRIEVDLPQLVIQSPGEFDFNLSPSLKYFGNLKQLREDIQRGIYTYKFLIKDSLYHSLETLLGPIDLIPIPIREGFIDNRRKVVFLTELDIYGYLPKKKTKFKGLFIDDLKGLKIDDYVVHSDYGIGQFKGLAQVDFDGKKVECLKIEYAGGDKVYLPVERLNQLERYIGSEDRAPRLSKIGSELWLKTKERVKKATEVLARDLINLYARRRLSPGFAFSKDSIEMQELEAGFPYEETPDQNKAIEDVKTDMESPKPMERLICGDVGFGKTEIAIRAAFKAALDSKQTMLLCPTTLLAFQHYNTFVNRLRNFPVRVELVSRFKSQSDLRKILEEISEGKIDIIIGTHRLLEADVVFKDLGLLIIDEEQRFGVMQKERIKRIKPNVDILYLSATPIPRTLYMSLIGLKDISVIHTPPPGRKEIITRVINFDDEKIKRIIRFELDRGGQIFFVHNRIQTIETIKDRLQKLLPDLRICLLHGRVKSEISEKKMIEFIEGRYDLLLSTAIVESGLDMPRVNTIIVNEADKFGLADLHQLRGRVGRADIQGYAYFIIPSKITQEAQKRLSALISYTTLGSGFRLAIRDMEIRGVGNILGKEQSGFVNAIGYHHYVKILNNVIQELQGKEVTIEPVLNLKIPGFIPKDYIPSPYERTALYKRLMDVQSECELNAIKEELIDRFGRYPEDVENLFLISKIRVLALNLNSSEVIQSRDLIRFFRNGKLIKEISVNALKCH